MINVSVHRTAWCNNRIADRRTKVHGISQASQHTQLVKRRFTKETWVRWLASRVLAAHVLVQTVLPALNATGKSLLVPVSAGHNSAHGIACFVQSWLERSGAAVKKMQSTGYTAGDLSSSILVFQHGTAAADGLKGC